jgi:polyisoprenoid-binding protein YceI
MSIRQLKARLGMLALAVFPVLGSVALPDEVQQKTGPPTYEVDVKASRIHIKVGTATRLGHEHGIEGNLKSGKVVFGDKGELVFDMASLTADTSEARKFVGLEKKKISQNEAKKVTKTMRSADVLDVEKHPTATFSISALKPLDKQAAGEPGAYQVEGAFSLHGTDNKLEFKAKVEKADKEGQLKATGKFTIKQTDYSMKPYATAGGLAKVADELEISGYLVLKPASGK